MTLKWKILELGARIDGITSSREAVGYVAKPATTQGSATRGQGEVDAAPDDGDGKCREQNGCAVNEDQASD